LWWSGFYTRATTFDVDKALRDPKSANYQLLLRDIDVIARELKKFQAAGIPVLWRPLHEADGGWFWWGAKGPRPFKTLWRLMYDRLTNHHQLHNLIWVYTGTPSKMNWYPGDDVVDVFGIDSYPSDRNDPLSSVWEESVAKFGGRKLIALTEFKGVPDVAKMRRYGVKWGYFVSWTGDLGTSSQDPAEVKRGYADAGVVNANTLKR
jgi:mannan endo-1,4-beta-mannosidase